MGHSDFVNCETETSILVLFFIFCVFKTFGLKVVQPPFIKANKEIGTSRLSRICEVYRNYENVTRPRSYEGRSPSLSDVADFKSKASWFS